MTFLSSNTQATLQRSENLRRVAASKNLDARTDFAAARTHLWDGAKAAIVEWSDTGADPSGENLYTEVKLALGGDPRKGDASKVRTVGAAYLHRGLRLGQFNSLSAAYKTARELLDSTAASDDDAAHAAAQSAAAHEGEGDDGDPAKALLALGIDAAVRKLLDALGTEAAHRGFARAMATEMVARQKAVDEAAAAAKAGAKSGKPQADKAGATKVGSVTKPATAKPKPATAKPKPATAKPATAKPKPEPKPEPKPKPATAKPKPATAKPATAKPATAKPKPEPKPEPKPKPKPEPKPATAKPKPATAKPKPATAKPKPEQ